MNDRKKKNAALEAAAEAHSDLTMFYALVGLLESRALSTAAQADEFRIIALCKRGASKALVRYDKAAALINRDKTSVIAGEK